MALADLTYTQTGRVKRFMVQPGHILIMLQGCFRVVANPLPRDAKVVSACYVEDRNQFSILVESEEYEPVPWGALIPMADAPVIKLIGS